MKSLSVYMVQKVWPRLKFLEIRYVDQRSRSRSLGQKFWHDWKGLIIRNVHMKYESSTSHGSKVMAKVKIFRNVGQRSWSKSQCHQLRCHLKGSY